MKIYRKHRIVFEVFSVRKVLTGLATSLYATKRRYQAQRFHLCTFRAPKHREDFESPSTQEFYSGSLGHYYSLTREPTGLFWLREYSRTCILSRRQALQSQYTAMANKWIITIRGASGKLFEPTMLSGSLECFSVGGGQF